MRHRLALTFVDVSLIIAATIGAQLLRDNFETRLDQLIALAPYALSTLVAAIAIVFAFGLNRSIWRLSNMHDGVRIIAGATAIVLSAVVLTFLYNRLEGTARALPAIQGLLIVAALVGVRLLARLRYVARALNVPSPTTGMASLAPQRTILIVGITPLAELYLRCIREFAEGTVRVAGVLGTNSRHIGRLIQQHPVLGQPEDARRVINDLTVHGLAIERIVVALPFHKLSARARAELLELERTLDITLEFFAENIGVAGRREAAPVPLPRQSNVSMMAHSAQHADLTPDVRRPYWRVKRVADVMGATVGLIVAAPLMLLIAIVVAIDCGFPVFFWQYRPGTNGRSMRLYKFRTMRGAHGSDGRRIPDADRLSVVGATLRRMRLDELPQLVNVLTGSMSFVGPRPLLPVDQQADMPERLAIRPGLTGWAQVKGGRDISPADKAALDLWYIKNASPLVDLRIVMATVRMVLLGERTDRGAIHQAWLALRPIGQLSQSSLGTAYRNSLDCAPILASKQQLGGDGGLTYAQRSRVL